MAFSVIEIVSGNEIVVTPNWVWAGKVGSAVKIVGYNLPFDESGKAFAKNKLENLLKGKTIELKNPVVMSTPNYLGCEVHLEGVNVARYFPEFQPK